MKRRMEDLRRSAIALLSLVVSASLLLAQDPCSRIFTPTPKNITSFFPVYSLTSTITPIVLQSGGCPGPGCVFKFDVSLDVTSPSPGLPWTLEVCVEPVVVGPKVCSTAAMKVTEIPGLVTASYASTIGMAVPCGSPTGKFTLELSLPGPPSHNVVAAECLIGCTACPQ